MTVAELIEILKQCYPDARVFDGDGEPINTIDSNDIHHIYIFHE